MQLELICHRCEEECKRMNQIGKAKLHYLCQFTSDVVAGQVGDRNHEIK